MVVDYQDSILSIMASLRRHYGLEASYKSDERFSKYLQEHDFKKIILVLIDAMGAKLINKYLNADSFINRNLKYVTSTVFPATTTAATTAILNGKAPNESCWLGWSEYDSELNEAIIPFLGKGFYSGKEYGASYFWDKYPTLPIYEELKQRAYSTLSLWPFGENAFTDFNDMVNCCLENKNKDFIYLYWDEYDNLMHLYGPDAEKCISHLKYIDQQLEYLANNLDDDTLLLVTADHGQIAIKEYYDLAKSKYNAYFSKLPALEGRAQSFWIKAEYREIFAQEFKEEFEDYFILLTHDEVIKTHLFGERENHPDFEQFIGDFLAIAKSDKAFVYENGQGINLFKGHHAGICEAEMLIPFLVYQRDANII